LVKEGASGFKVYMLLQVADLCARQPCDAPGIGKELTAQDLDHRRFPGAICADERDMLSK
jgi:hypothetical protein